MKKSVKSSQSNTATNLAIKRIILLKNLSVKAILEKIDILEKRYFKAFNSGLKASELTVTANLSRSPDGKYSETYSLGLSYEDSGDGQKDANWFTSNVNSV